MYRWRLDKGIVIDAWVRVSLVGIDLITVEARVVVASIDTYSKYSGSGWNRRRCRQPREIGSGDEFEAISGAKTSSSAANSKDEGRTTSSRRSPDGAVRKPRSPVSFIDRRGADFGTLTSHLLAQLADVTAARRAVMLKIDAAQHSLVVVAANGFESAPAFSVSLGDLSSPLVICALSLLPIRGESELEPRALGDGAVGRVVDVSAPAARITEVMKRGRAAELVSSRSASVLLSLDRRVATSPAGVVVLSGNLDAAAADSAIQLIALASPIVARLGALAATNWPTSTSTASGSRSWSTRSPTRW